MINIKTNRMLLRNFSIDDWKHLQEIIIDKETSEYATYDHAFPISDIEIKKVTEWFSSGDKFIAAYELNDNKLIGYIALNGDDEKEKDLGFCFSNAYQGKGYAKEASIAVINYAFNTLKVERLTSGTANLNVPSVKLLNKLGFKKTSEEKLAFRKDAEGNPIEFVGSSYILDKDKWMSMEFCNEHN